MKPFTVPGLAAVATAAALLLPASPAVASSAQPPGPTPVVQPAYGGWQHLTRRPHHVAAVNPAGTLVSQIHWQYWGHRTAYGRGWPATDCPSFANPAHILRVGVLLYRVRSHHGTRYFSRMKLSCHDGPAGSPAQHINLSFEDGAQIGWDQTSPAAQRS
jgi:hypothetical protein